MMVLAESRSDTNLLVRDSLDSSMRLEYYLPIRVKFAKGDIEAYSGVQ